MIIRLENSRRVRPFEFYNDAIGTLFVPEEFDFPEDELGDRITETEFQSIIEDLNEHVYEIHHRESRILCYKFSYTAVGLIITVVGLILVFSSLVAVGIRNRQAGLIYLWTCIACGIVTCIVGLAIIAFPRKPQKWKEKALAWSENQNCIYGGKGLIFRVDDDQGPSPVVEKRPLPTKVYDIKTGQLSCSIPTFIPPKNVESISMP